MSGVVIGGGVQLGSDKGKEGREAGSKWSGWGLSGGEGVSTIIKPRDCLSASCSIAA